MPCRQKELLDLLQKIPFDELRWGLPQIGGKIVGWTEPYYFENKGGGKGTVLRIAGGANYNTIAAFMCFAEKKDTENPKNSKTYWQAVICQASPINSKENTDILAQNIARDSRLLTAEKVGLPESNFGQSFFISAIPLDSFHTMQSIIKEVLTSMGFIFLD